MKLKHGLIFFLLFSRIAFSAPIPGDNSGETASAEKETVEDKPQPPRQPEIIDLPEPKADQVCAPISFWGNDWISASNNNASDYPIITKKGELILLPDNRFGAATAAIYDNRVKPPFEVKFEFSTYDDDGGQSSARRWNSADGISFFFLSDGKNYGTPEGGGKMGLSKGAKGYAISFPTYGTRKVRLVETGVRQISRQMFRDAYSHGQWIPVTVQVAQDKVTVTSKERTLIDTPQDLSQGAAGSSFGFAAATGAADSEHKIRNLCLRKL